MEAGSLDSDRVVDYAVAPLPVSLPLTVECLGRACMSCCLEVFHTLGRVISWMDGHEPGGRLKYHGTRST